MPWPNHVTKNSTISAMPRPNWRHTLLSRSRSLRMLRSIANTTKPSDPRASTIARTIAHPPALIGSSFLRLAVHKNCPGRIASKRAFRAHQGPGVSGGVVELDGGPVVSVLGAERGWSSSDVDAVDLHSVPEVRHHHGPSAPLRRVARAD